MPEADEETTTIPAPDLSGFEEDSQANREVNSWGRQDELSRVKHDNALAIHKTIKFLIPGALILSFLGFAALTTIYVLHLVLPIDSRWLSADEVQHLHSMIFSGVVGGAIAILGKMYLGTAKDE